MVNLQAAISEHPPLPVPTWRCRDRAKLFFRDRITPPLGCRQEQQRLLDVRREAKQVHDLCQPLRETVNDWVADKAPRLGAALAYYTVFSLAPLLIIALNVAGLVFDPTVVQSRLNSQFEQLLGSQGAEAVATN